jgi:ubiquinone/menaquinone biosynthesis C-methylase UbiE
MLYFYTLQESFLLFRLTKILWTVECFCQKVFKRQEEKCDTMKIGRFEKFFMKREHHKKHTINRARKLMDFIKWTENQNFLEVGCGSGAVSLFCAQTYHLNVTGIDVDPDMIRLAQADAHDLNVHFAVEDSTQLTFEDESFAIVLSFGVMHHIPNWLDALEEIRRVLKPKGYFMYWDIMYPRIPAKIAELFARNYGITTLDKFNQFIEQNNFSKIHFSVLKSLQFYELETVLQKQQIAK